jgi:hypothetical protein
MVQIDYEIIIFLQGEEIPPTPLVREWIPSTIETNI